MIRPSQWVLRALCEYNRFRYRLKARRWQGRGYDVPYLQSSGERSGSTLVFLHGLGASKDQWGRTFIRWCARTTVCSWTCRAKVSRGSITHIAIVQRLRSSV